MSGSEKQRLEIDRRILFTALGFTAVALKGVPADDQEERVNAMAQLIESFCRLHVPEAFEGDDAVVEDALTRERMVAAIVEIMRADGRCARHELRGTFSDEEIERHWWMAYGLACVTLNKTREVS